MPNCGLKVHLSLIVDLRKLNFRALYELLSPYKLIISFLDVNFSENKNRGNDLFVNQDYVSKINHILAARLGPIYLHTF